MVAKRLLNFHVVEEGPVVILLEVALAVLKTAGEGVPPTADEPSGSVAQRCAGESKAAYFLFDGSLAGGFDAGGDNIDGSTDGRQGEFGSAEACLLYTSPSPRDRTRSRMPSSA